MPTSQLLPNVQEQHGRERSLREKTHATRDDIQQTRGQKFRAMRDLREGFQEECSFLPRLEMPPTLSVSSQQRFPRDLCPGLQAGSPGDQKFGS